ncbi:hypothetical protein AVEN_43172-1 [Araneus ventricosus]|uniref:Uncharacterized protein n=1 Tax=Araneus ventricosus TaxID=182803 RepID=A0A4Y2F0A0_ARAVE|nr:hypothetical protein AVEN_43172-1 [Araneus ventricosus]
MLNFNSVPSDSYITIRYRNLHLHYVLLSLNKDTTLLINSVLTIYYIYKTSTESKHISSIQSLYIQFVRISSNGEKRQEKLYKILRHCSTSLKTVEAVMAASCKAGREEVSSGKASVPPSVEAPWKASAGRLILLDEMLHLIYRTSHQVRIIISVEVPGLVFKNRYQSSSGHLGIAA